MQCEYCPREFPENMDGLATRTFHMILWHANLISPRKINAESGIPAEDANSWGGNWHRKTKQQGNHGRYGIGELN